MWKDHKVNKGDKNISFIRFFTSSTVCKNAVS